MNLKQIDFMKPEEDKLPESQPSPMINSRSVTRSRKTANESFMKMGSDTPFNDRELASLEAFHTRRDLHHLSEIGPLGDTHLNELPLVSDSSHSPSVASYFPQLVGRSLGALRSETVDENPNELILLPEISSMRGENDANAFFEIKKQSFRDAEILIVIEDINSADTKIPKGEKLEIVGWINDHEIQVKASNSDETTTLDLLPLVSEHLRPYGVTNTDNLQMFTLTELMETVDVELKLIFDDNVVEVIKDFIQLRPRYFQEHQNVGGRIPLFPVSSITAGFNDLMVRNDESYEMKHVSLMRDGSVQCQIDENFQGKLPIADLSSWAFVKLQETWKVVLMTDEQEVKEVLDFHEVFQDPTRDVLLPFTHTTSLPLTSNLPSLQMLDSRDLLTSEIVGPYKTYQAYKT